jgi:predicted RNA-binding Zn-ribbon protein involved in translation (DUF1610 family)
VDNSSESPIPPRCVVEGPNISVESDYIVALNTAQYGSGYPGPNCGRSITISYGGKTAQATIMDQCPSCGYGDLDLSRSLFNHFSVSPSLNFLSSLSPS